MFQTGKVERDMGPRVENMWLDGMGLVVHPVGEIQYISYVEVMVENVHT